MSPKEYITPLKEYITPHHKELDELFDEVSEHVSPHVVVKETQKDPHPAVANS